MSRLTGRGPGFLAHLEVVGRAVLLEVDEQRVQQRVGPVGQRRSQHHQTQGEEDTAPPPKSPARVRMQETPEAVGFIHRGTVPQQPPPPSPRRELNGPPELEVFAQLSV